MLSFFTINKYRLLITYTKLISHFLGYFNFFNELTFNVGNSAHKNCHHLFPPKIRPNN